MKKYIEDFLDKYYEEDEPIILGCSTGPDSMYLLYHILDSKYAKNVVACYFNHKLRPEADDEEKFLEELGKKRGFKVEIAEGNIREIKEKFYKADSIEEVARRKRYEFFDTILHLYNSNKILLAHHLDDKIETFFFNLVRGSKLTGLINMTEKSGPILRPLLNIEKIEILRYLNENKLEYKIDDSNYSTDYSRNKLRIDILPQFYDINSNYKENVSNLINYLGELKENIDDMVLAFLNMFYDEGLIEKHGRYFEIGLFNSLSSFMQKEIVRYIYYISNGNSTIGLSESNIDEVLRFINGKNNKTIKDIKNMKLRKENKIILY